MTLPKAAVKRIAKDAGAERISDEALDLINGKVEEYIAALVTKGNKMANHAGRKTITAKDLE
jgi:histone H3/H4